MVDILINTFKSIRKNKMNKLSIIIIKIDDYCGIHANQKE